MCVPTPPEKQTFSVDLEYGKLGVRLYMGKEGNFAPI